jgi:hypothetical protein
MSDHNTPDPVDRVYAEAEALLGDDAARRARRSRVLEAVTREPGPETKAAPARAHRPSGWRYVGWLTAASIAGLGGLIAYQLSPVAGLPPVAGPGEVSSGARPPSAANPPPGPDAPVEVQAHVQDRAAPAAPARYAPPPEERAPEAVQNAAAPMAPPVAPPPVLAPEAAAPPPPPAAFPQERLESAEARRATAAPVAAPAPSARVQGAAAASSSSLGARLRAAVTAGRTSEVAELLAEGAPVDARDSDGETALMKSIRANQPETAALLRRRGADPDLENRAGVSARDMARAAGEPALERALETGR